MHLATQFLSTWKNCFPENELRELLLFYDKNYHQFKNSSEGLIHFLLEMDERTGTPKEMMDNGNIHRYIPAAFVLGWRFGKIVIAIHEVLFKQLQDSSFSRIPFRALNSLPFKQFFVELPDIPLLYQNKTYISRGCFVNYEKQTAMMMLFHLQDREENRQFWHAVVIATPDYHADESGELDLEWSVNQTKKYQKCDVANLVADNLLAIKTVIKVCLYLASKNADYQAPKLPGPVKTKRGMRVFETKTPQVIKIGNLFAQSIKRWEEDSSLPGNKIAPHLRRAHFALYHTKSGDELIWRSAAFVNLHLFQENDLATYQKTIY